MVGVWSLSIWGEEWLDCGVCGVRGDLSMECVG